jgi:hypothetical protein
MRENKISARPLQKNKSSRKMQNKIAAASSRCKLFFVLISVFLCASQIAIAQSNPQQPGQPRVPANSPASTDAPDRQPTYSPSNIPDMAPPPETPVHPGIVYVGDFELESDSAANSTAEAQHILKLMSDSLLQDLRKAGYTAKVLHHSDTRPDSGMLITGIFTQRDKDNQLRRALVNTGASTPPMQLYVTASDMAHFAPALYEPDSSDADANKPGAVITLNSSTTPAQFDVESNATDKTIKKIAKQITDKLDKLLAEAAARAQRDPLNRYAKP